MTYKLIFSSYCIVYFHAINRKHRLEHISNCLAVQRLYCTSILLKKYSSIKLLYAFNIKYYGKNPIHESFELR